MPNRWITFVKSWAAKKGLSYGCALSQPQLKTDYRKAYPTKQQEKFREAVERGEMEDEDVRSRAVQNEVKQKNAERKKKIQPSRDRLGMLQEDLISQLSRKADKTKELRGKMVKELKAKQEEKKRNIEMSRMMGEDRNVSNVRNIISKINKKPTTEKKKPILIIEEDEEEIPAKKSRGRPKKYDTKEEARTARIEKTKESNKRMREMRKKLLEEARAKLREQNK